MEKVVVFLPVSEPGLDVEGANRFDDWTYIDEAVGLGVFQHCIQESNR
jgi:hypothetical protein